MAKATLPAQALPPEKRPKPAPPPFEDMLPSGLMVKWRMPDPIALVMFDGILPDRFTAAIIGLLKREKSYTPEDDPRRFQYDAADHIGMLALAAAMLESPKLDLDVEYGDGDTLGRREIGMRDVSHLYYAFLLGTRQPPLRTPDPAQPVRPAGAASDRGDVSPDASGTDAD